MMHFFPPKPQLHSWNTNWTKNELPKRKKLVNFSLLKQYLRQQSIAWALVTKLSCSRLLDRFQKRISVDGWKRSENDTKTLVWMQIFCSVFIRWKRCVFKNALVWFRPKPRISIESLAFRLRRILDFSSLRVLFSFKYWVMWQWQNVLKEMVHAYALLLSRYAFTWKVGRS